MEKEEKREIKRVEKRRRKRNGEKREKKKDLQFLYAFGSHCIFIHIFSSLILLLNEDAHNRIYYHKSTTKTKP